MVATRCPKFISATATFMASVDFPAPPFSLPSTTTCAAAGRPVLGCTNNIFGYLTPDQFLSK